MIPKPGCPHPIRCELEGCHTTCARQASVPVPARQPIDLAPLQKGKLLDALRRFGWKQAVAAAAAPSPPPLTDTALLRLIQEALTVPDSDHAPAPAPAPAGRLPPSGLQTGPDLAVRPDFSPPPPLPRGCSEVRARRVGSGWLIYADGKEVEVAKDSEIGGVVAALAAK